MSKTGDDSIFAAWIVTVDDIAINQVNVLTFID